LLSKYKSFDIQYSKRDRISKLVKFYSEEESGTVVALFNHNNLLEIAMVDGEASSLLGFKVGSNILIQFYD
jgi:S-adenosylmethionine hydrolase